jgi:hypothetical protein
MGSGNASGVQLVHLLASEMNGMRTAGDPVMRMRMTRGLRLKEAKAQTADRHRVSARDLSDGVVMQDARSECGIGRLTDVGNEGGDGAAVKRAKVAPLDGAAWRATAWSGSAVAYAR